MKNVNLVIGCCETCKERLVEEKLWLNPGLARVNKVTLENGTEVYRYTTVQSLNSGYNLNGLRIVDITTCGYCGELNEKIVDILRSTIRLKHKKED